MNNRYYFHDNEYQYRPALQRHLTNCAHNWTKIILSRCAKGPPDKRLYKVFGFALNIDKNEYHKEHFKDCATSTN